MRKQDELTNAASCINRAHPKEMVFVLLGRDPAAPAAIRAWADERVRLGKNKDDDPQIVEARACADTMQSEGRTWANNPEEVVGHLVGGEFQSDKYPWCQRGFVPLKVTDKDAQPQLLAYAQTHRERDPQFSEDLETALRNAGYDGSHV
jgi:hypothetical protein